MPPNPKFDCIVGGENECYLEFDEIGGPFYQGTTIKVGKSLWGYAHARVRNDGDSGDVWFLVYDKTQEKSLAWDYYYVASGDHKFFQFVPFKVDWLGKHEIRFCTGYETEPGTVTVTDELPYSFYIVGVNFIKLWIHNIVVDPPEPEPSQNFNISALVLAVKTSYDLPHTVKLSLVKKGWPSNSELQTKDVTISDLDKNYEVSFTHSEDSEGTYDYGVIPFGWSNKDWDKVICGENYVIYEE